MNEYTAESLTVVTLEEHVRKRPAMHFGLSRENPLLATAMALATRTTIELCAGARKWRQEMVGAAVVGEPQDLGPTDDRGSRVTIDLDPDYFGREAAVTRDRTVLLTDRFGEQLTWTAGTLRIVDLRTD